MGPLLSFGGGRGMGKLPRLGAGLHGIVCDLSVMLILKNTSGAW